MINILRTQTLIRLLLVSLILPLGVGLIVLHHNFDGLYGQDAFAYYDYATVDLRNQLFPPPPFFWPPGYPLLILGTSSIIGVTPLAGQLVSLICGGLTVLFTMLLARELFPETVVPLTAGLMIALSGQLWQSSTVIMADTTSLAAATLGMWALVRYARNPTAFWLALAAGGVSYAVITRWVYAVLAIVCGVYALYLLLKLPRRKAIIHSAYAALAVAFILGPVLVAALLSPRDLQTTYGGNFQYQLVRWDLSNAFRRDFVNPDGHQVLPTSNGIYYATLPMQDYYLTPFLGLFVFAGLYDIVRRNLFWTFVPVLAWGVGVYLLLIGGPQQNVRFALTYLIPFVIIAGMGVSMVWNYIIQIRIVRELFVFLMFAAFINEAAQAVDFTQKFIGRKQAMLDVVRWVEATIPAESQLITLSATAMMKHYTTLETHEIYYLVPDDLEPLIETTQPTYLLLDVYNVETQWVGNPPSINYYWLKDHKTLEKLGNLRGYTLFVVTE